MEKGQPSATPEPPAADPAVLGAASDLLRLLVKAQKTRQLYQGNNPICEQLEAELTARINEYTEEHGDLSLSIREAEILLDEHVVHEAPERRASLPFLLFRDGIHTLTFLPGVDREEVNGLLAALNHVASVQDGQDDLVTLLWQGSASDERGVKGRAPLGLYDVGRASCRCPFVATADGQQPIT